jgi:hypothetical protein
MILASCRAGKISEKDITTFRDPGERGHEPDPRACQDLERAPHARTLHARIVSIFLLSLDAQTTCPGFCIAGIHLRRSSAKARSASGFMSGHQPKSARSYY